MFDTTDTIVAIATPPGRGGIGVVRLSGPHAIDIARTLGERDSLEPRRATFVRVRNDAGLRVDHAVVTAFPAPHSYTGEDVVEISVHGSPVVLRDVLRGAMTAGARLAEPGEFTLRAHLHGRLDLVQAEAVADLIEAVTPRQARLAFDQLEGTLTSRIRDLDATLLDLIAALEASLDFPDEGYHFVTPDAAAAQLRTIGEDLDRLLGDAAAGRVIREGRTAVIVGRPNAGKSSLFNALASADRAIVTDVAGTTRDLLTERIDVEGVPFTVVDTAGLRQDARDPIEREGMSRARQAHAVADVILVLLDRSRPLANDDEELVRETAGRPRVVVASKSDLDPAWQTAPCGADTVPVSSVTGAGLDNLRRAIIEIAGVIERRDPAAIANVRHADLVRRARGAMARAEDAASAGASEEFVLADLHEARAAFEELTGARTPDDVLRRIFERFCIGK
jgi:tRNA modification GTPase